jgi:membrane protein YqaA with SNARE-associated domain
MTIKSNNKQNTPSSKEKNWLKRNLLSALLFILVACITISLFIFRDEFASFGNWGYIGAFLVSLVANATIVLPMPSLMVLFPMGAAFNPFFIGLAAGIGGTFGELTAYLAGYSGRGIWHENRTYLKAVEWLQRWGMFIVFVYSVTPMPIDAMGLAAGNLRFPVWKYALACFPGKLIKYTGIALAGRWGWDQFINSEYFRTTTIAAAIAVVVVLVLLAAALFLERWDWKRK